MVLPVRIELTTSPLPRGCSTTELRQRVLNRNAGDACHTGQKQASAEATCAFTPRVEHRGTVIVNEAAENKAKINREQRLSAALRENLKRRKVQARARSIDTRTSDAAPAHDSAGIREKDKEEA